jgi:hypothetical protein
MPSFKSGGAAASVQVESDPPGAEARLGPGAGCRTPCSLAISEPGNYSVTLALAGYLPQSVPIRVIRVQQAGNLTDVGVPEQVVVDPNPVYAQLELAPPPPPPPKKRAPPKRKPQPAAAQPAQPAPPPFGPPPQPPGFR